MENTESRDLNSILNDLVVRAESLSAKVKELKAAEIELVKVNQAIEALGGRAVNNVVSFVKAILDVYNASLSWPDKVKYAVKKLGHASVQDIIQELKRVEPSLAKEPERLHNNVTTVASGLAIKGELVAYKDGIKNIYSLPKNNP